MLALPNFKGCIELDYLNEEVISLYSFVDVFNLNTTVDIPCARSVCCSCISFQYHCVNANVCVLSVEFKLIAEH